ncbi:MAG: 50S ribosomal protein L22 [Candidatus Woesearchaeota archaeon]
MADYNYSTQINGEKTARAVGRDLGISTKFSIEICRLIRYKNLKKAKALLELTLDMKRAIPFKRAVFDLGHKPGMAAGRFPLKACEGILEILNSVEKNAAFKNLDVNNLKIVHINAQKASRPYHPGRQSGTKHKRSHIEIVVAEQKAPKAAEKKTAQSKSKKAPEAKQ